MRWETGGPSFDLSEMKTAEVRIVDLPEDGALTIRHQGGAREGEPDFGYNFNLGYVGDRYVATVLLNPPREAGYWTDDGPYGEHYVPFTLVYDVLGTLLTRADFQDVIFEVSPFGDGLEVMLSYRVSAPLGRTVAEIFEETRERFESYWRRAVRICEATVREAHDRARGQIALNDGYNDPNWDEE